MTRKAEEGEEERERKKTPPTAPVNCPRQEGGVRQLLRFMHRMTFAVWWCGAAAAAAVVDVVVAGSKQIRKYCGRKYSHALLVFQ